MRKTASNANIWTKCEGYIKIANDFIERHGRIPSAAAEEGTMAHQIAEYLIKLMATTGNAQSEIPDKWGEKVIPVDMKIKVHDYAHLCFSLMRRAMVFGGRDLWVERKVTCDFLSKDTDAIIDFALYDRAHKSLIVNELKYGHRPVHAVMNPQLLICARAIIDQLKLDGELVESVYLGVYQPNGPMASVPFNQWTTHRDNVNAVTQHIQELFHSDSDALTPGGHCRYCPARAGCHAVTRALFEAWDVMSMYNGIPAELSVDALEGMLVEVAAIKDLLRGYETGLEALVVSRLKKGEDFPHWEYSTSLSDRKWAYPDKDIIEMGKSMGLDLEIKRIVSPKQAETMGFPKEVVETLVRRDATGLKLRRKSLKTLNQAFG